MYEIRFDLNNSHSLNTMAAPVPMYGGGAVPPGMAIPGIYCIFNTVTHNRYLGIAGNIANRFNGRMGVINEMGFAQAALQGIWAWWGTVSTREFPPPADFPEAFPTSLANLANRYAYPVGAAPTVCPNPLGHAAAPTPPQALLEAVAPIRYACAAYFAFTHSVVPRNAVTIVAAWPGMLMPFGPPMNAAAIAGMPSALGAAQIAAGLAGVPAADAAILANVIHASIGGGVLPASPFTATVQHLFGAGPAPALPLGPTAYVVRNPVGGPPTSVTHSFVAGGGVIDLEHVFIAFALRYLTAGLAYCTNGMKIGPVPWPAGHVEPICVTWFSRDAPGTIHVAFERSVMWWPNTAF